MTQVCDLAEWRQRLASWDGKSAKELEAFYACYGGEGYFATTILTFSTEPTAAQPAATWLLKRHLESGATLSAEEALELYESVAHFRTSWPVTLHLLQSIPFVPVPASCAAELVDVLVACCAQPEKMVRAWAYNGLYLVGLQHPAYQRQVTSHLARAQQDDAPSVRARIRKLPPFPA